MLIVNYQDGFRYVAITTLNVDLLDIKFEFLRKLYDSPSYKNETHIKS